MTEQEVFQKVEDAGVVAVLVIDDADKAVPLAEALLAGGITAMELTLRTDAALPALDKISAAVPEMLAGIGTILTQEQAEQVYDAGAAFGVSPGVNPSVIERALAVGLPFAPGIVTPSDVERALEYDRKLLKFFPAGPMGGLNYLKAMSAPYNHLGVKYIPLGGLNQQNMTEYLADPLIAGIGGSWLAPKDAIAEDDWARITDLAQKASDAVKYARR